MNEVSWRELIIFVDGKYSTLWDFVNSQIPSPYIADIHLNADESMRDTSKLYMVVNMIGEQKPTINWSGFSQVMMLARRRLKRVHHKLK